MYEELFDWSVSNMENSNQKGDYKVEAGSKKKKPVLIFILLGILVVAAAVILYLQYARPSEPDSVRFKSEYPLVSEDNPFVYKNATEIVRVMEKGTGIIFSGFSSCIWCQAYVTILNEVAIDMGVKEILYLDIQQDREDDSRQYRRMVELLEGRLELNEDGKPRIFVPDFTVVKDGVIIGHDNETCMLSGMDPSEYWTNAKANALKQRLEAMMREVQ